MSEGGASVLQTERECSDRPAPRACDNLLEEIRYIGGGRSSSSSSSSDTTDQSFITGPNIQEVLCQVKDDNGQPYFRVRLVSKETGAFIRDQWTTLEDLPKYSNYQDTLQQFEHRLFERERGEIKRRIWENMTSETQSLYRTLNLGLDMVSKISYEPTQRLKALGRDSSHRNRWGKRGRRTSYVLVNGQFRPIKDNMRQIISSVTDQVQCGRSRKRRRGKNNQNSADNDDHYLCHPVLPSAVFPRLGASPTRELSEQRQLRGKAEYKSRSPRSSSPGWFRLADIMSPRKSKQRQGYKHDPRKRIPWSPEPELHDLRPWDPNVRVVVPVVELPQLPVDSGLRLLSGVRQMRPPDVDERSERSQSSRHTLRTSSRTDSPRALTVPNWQWPRKMQPVVEIEMRSSPILSGRSTLDPHMMDDSEAVAGGPSANEQGKLVTPVTATPHIPSLRPKKGSESDAEVDACSASSPLTIGTDSHDPTKAPVQQPH
ncbi:hypothetical protein EV182_000695 [Spiromyces aspiralis]|uniref:Uncharacterized protein n=1 Tax=Spiromyces aspiralis TaxID=68401 RepID=A0ACC1HUJ0_9FUNG|nr:hypothetical protein EV182_000695 [Spiromyces aspiralis]